MRTFRITQLIILVLCLCAVSCSKNLTESNDFGALNPGNQDLNAGTWKTVLLTSPTEFAVSAPVATNTPGYVAELNEIKALQANLGDKEKKIIEYWSAGAVLRWNEIMRELVAKYNLPPYQKEDGTYPAPSAANPFAYPLFPFANPPYAARAYAYVAAAQYDALVAAWHYKSLYSRKSPYLVDSSIVALVPMSELPSYPSEDAVVAGATVELMKLLFPTEIAFVQEKAYEHKLYRMMAGANVRSELEAGEALGKQVAQKFVARARTDRAGQAIGTPAIWKQFEDETIAKGEQCWLSLETPKRPPMLPLFGKVKAFLFDSLTAISLRPPPPPSTNSDAFRAECEEVKKFSEDFSRDRMEIVHFWADGAGTYTPPGHWNAIAAEEFVKESFSEVRWARNFALLNMSLMDAAIVCWDAKFFYFNPRPSQVMTEIKTITGVPNFPSYTSGHSTFSGAAATILGHILKDRAQLFDEMAEEASLSRMYGGIHYRSDCEQGLIAGKKIGAYAVERAKTDGAE
jgi:hypothetical protein